VGSSFPSCPREDTSHRTHHSDQRLLQGSHKLVPAAKKRPIHRPRGPTRMLKLGGHIRAVLSAHMEYKLLQTQVGPVRSVRYNITLAMSGMRAHSPPSGWNLHMPNTLYWCCQVRSLEHKRRRDRCPCCNRRPCHWGCACCRSAFRMRRSG
jgi:hypothetical protein